MDRSVLKDLQRYLEENPTTVYSYKFFDHGSEASRLKRVLNRWHECLLRASDGALSQQLSKKLGALSGIVLPALRTNLSDSFSGAKLVHFNRVAHQVERLLDQLSIVLGTRKEGEWIEMLSGKVEKICADVSRVYVSDAGLDPNRCFDVEGPGSSNIAQCVGSFSVQESREQAAAQSAIVTSSIHSLNLVLPSPPVANPSNTAPIPLCVEGCMLDEENCIVEDWSESSSCFPPASTTCLDASAFDDFHVAPLAPGVIEAFAGRFSTGERSGTPGRTTVETRRSRCSSNPYDRCGNQRMELVSRSNAASPRLPHYSATGSRPMAGDFTIGYQGKDFICDGQSRNFASAGQVEDFPIGGQGRHFANCGQVKNFTTGGWRENLASGGQNENLGNGSRMRNSASGGEVGICNSGGGKMKGLSLPAYQSGISHTVEDLATREGIGDSLDSFTDRRLWPPSQMKPNFMQETAMCEAGARVGSAGMGLQSGNDQLPVIAPSSQGSGFVDPEVEDIFDRMEPKQGEVGRFPELDKMWEFVRAVGERRGQGSGSLGINVRMDLGVQGMPMCDQNAMNTWLDVGGVNIFKPPHVRGQGIEENPLGGQGNMVGSAGDLGSGGMVNLNGGQGNAGQPLGYEGNAGQCKGALTGVVNAGGENNQMDPFLSNVADWDVDDLNMDIY